MGLLELKDAEEQNDAGKPGAKISERIKALGAGMKTAWMILSSFTAFCGVFAVYYAFSGHKPGAVIFAVLGCGALIVSNFWFRSHVVNPLLGLVETAKRIAGGSYGTLAEKQREDEIGSLTDAINEMSASIGKANKTQTEFISSVSHELRTPLTAIAGWSETLLYDEAIQDDSRRGVNIILKESGRLTIMVEELLEFTRIHDGRFTLNVETMDFCAEIEDILFTYGQMLKQEGGNVIYSPPPASLPSVIGDPHRLKQVILNLLDNASKHGGGSDIEISVRQNGDFIITKIRDHGAGISEADLPHVKEKFYKGNAKERGSGIGLSVCDEIVTRHGGTLSVQNADNGGTVVTVSLPVQTQKDTAR